MACTSNYCVAVQGLVATPVSSGSILLTAQSADDARCCAADFEVLMQRKGEETWRTVSAPLFGRRLPLEVMVADRELSLIHI